MDALTVEYRAATDVLEERAARRIAQTWARLNLADVAAVRDAMIEATNVTTVAYGEASGLLTAEYYDDTRQIAKPSLRYTAQVDASFNPDAVDSSIRWAVDPLTRDDPTTALSLVQVVAASMLRSIGSQTIQNNVAADPAAVGWNRIARADSCDFCVMLSQRGAVYKRKTADFAAHDNDRCTARPSWDPTAPEVDARAYTASERTTKMRDLDALDGGDRYERHKTSIRSWTEALKGDLDTFRSELL